MGEFDLKKYLAEGKLLKENSDLESYYPEWAAGEVRVGNDNVIDNGGVNANLEDLPGETLETFKSYVEAVIELNADSKELREDIASAISAIIFDGGDYESYEFDVLTKDQFKKIKTLQYGEDSIIEGNKLLKENSGVDGVIEILQEYVIDKLGADEAYIPEYDIPAIAEEIAIQFKLA